MTGKAKDPTVTSAIKGDAYPEGTHPARAPEETYHGQPAEYRENPGKPDKSTIAQIEVLPEDKS